MPGTNEALFRVKIDAQLWDQGWDVLDIIAVRFESVLPDRMKADYVLCDRNGRALAVVEAKKVAIDPAEAETQARGYAEQLGVPYFFLANGEEIRFWEWGREAFPRLQGQFEQRCTEVRSILAQQDAAATKAEAAFQSLLTRAFRVDPIATSLAEEVE